MKNTDKTMEKIVSLCKGRGFVYSGSEIYGGLANTWDYGPLGVELKNNVKRALQCRAGQCNFDESADMGGVRPRWRIFRSADGL